MNRNDIDKLIQILEHEYSIHKYHIEKLQNLVDNHKAMMRRLDKLEDQLEKHEKTFNAHKEPIQGG
jgi:hypothetical protein